MKTAQVLQAMLTENTGGHFLDSGGAYGRAWQRNQGRDFATEPVATLSIEEGFIDIRRSTFHFLKECLEFNEAMNDRFYEYADYRGRIPWLTLMEDFAESIEATGIYGEGDPIIVTTDDHASLLDQVIQYVYFEVDEEGYVLLQIHGGCDVRGGYTEPKAFRCNIEWSPSIFDDGRADVLCASGDHRWYAEEGDWDTDHEDDPNANETQGLDEFLIISQEFPFMADMPENDKPLIWRDAKGTVCPGPEGWEEVIWQDEKGVHCPLCGGILEVW